jgi:quinoprotein glucose dehydrogenase
MSRSSIPGALALTASIALVISTPAQMPAGTSGGDWPSYAGDLRNQHYAPLDQITAANFNTLEVAWRFKTDSFGTRPEYKLEGTPLVVRGVAYTTAGTRRAVVAIDAGTGELLWSHHVREGARAAASPRQLSGRGVAYWTDGKDERIVYVTTGYQLVALNAKTGAMIPSFGQKGIVDLKQYAVFGSGQRIDPITGEIGLHATPAVTTSGVVLVGSAMREGGTPRTHNNTKGLVLALDVRTGKKLWQFNTIPRPGEFGNDTWLYDSWAVNGNVGVWNQMAVDEELNLAYLPVETPSSDFYGGHRPGNNLFAESIVAIDVTTGKRKWHFQLVHHPIWNMDISAAPILADITVDGKAVKAVAVMGKQAMLYLFDRVTGTPVFPIEERPVPKGDVPGEWYSPTQPFPTKPPPYDHQGVMLDNLIDFTPELRAEAVKLVARYKLGPLFTPPPLSKAEGPIASFRSSGGTNWPGSSFDPESHVLFVPSYTSLPAVGLMPPPSAEFSDIRYVSGNALTGVRYISGPGENAGADVEPGRGRGGRGGAPATPAAPARGRSTGRGATPPAAAPAPTAPASPAPAPAASEDAGNLNPRGLPLLKPPYGRITAVNLDRGEFVWQIAHGETPDAVRNNAALKGLTIPRTGQAGAVGALVTKTLLIVGEPSFTTLPGRGRGAMLRAYDKATGKEVGAIAMAAPQTGTPMTYLHNGRQHIIIAISGGNYSGEYVAYRLP